jgi:hypothetical protein
VLFRDVYRGTITWNRSRKRNRWGVHKQAARPEGEWLSIPAPDLRIVDEDVWTAAHARLATVRAVYLTATGGQPFGRPMLGDASKYLLTNLALCGCAADHCASDRARTGPAASTSTAARAITNAAGPSARTTRTCQWRTRTTS